jgi:hypothetical protein
MNPAIWFALAASVLFGSSTPLAKMLLDSVSPALLSGLRYVESGVGLFAVRLWRGRGWKPHAHEHRGISEFLCVCEARLPAPVPAPTKVPDSCLEFLVGGTQPGKPVGKACQADSEKQSYLVVRP